jgi:pyruvate kinase
MVMQRGTKILATMGAASSDPSVLELLLTRGVNAVRLDFAQGSAQEHAQRAMLVRDIAERLGICVAILADLRGPGVRLGLFKSGAIELKKGDHFTLDAACKVGDGERVGITPAEQLAEIKVGDVLSFNGGRFRLRVQTVEGAAVHCEALDSGRLSDHQRIRCLGHAPTSPAVTEKDAEDIRTAAALGADYIAVSCPRSAADMHIARSLLKASGGKVGLIAKIECREAIANVADILDASDGIMLAREDLAAEAGDAAAAGLQKQMIRLARQHHKLVITATQMLESMVDSPVPTQAEVADVANAVLDGTDAVMLSAGSAGGRYPVEAVDEMHKACVEAERFADESQLSAPVQEGWLQSVETVVMSVVYASRHLPLKAVVALTRSGKTAMMMSRYRLGVPVYAMTPTLNTYRRLALCRQVFAILAPECNNGTDAERIDRVQSILKKNDLTALGDSLCVTYGAGRCGDTDSMRFIKAH